MDSLIDAKQMKFDAKQSIHEAKIAAHSAYANAVMPALVDFTQDSVQLASEYAQDALNYKVSVKSLYADALNDAMQGASSNEGRSQISESSDLDDTKRSSDEQVQATAMNAKDDFYSYYTPRDDYYTPEDEEPVPLNALNDIA